MINSLRTLRNVYGNRKFRTKIIINFFIINLIITVSVGLIYYFKATSIIDDELTRSLDYSISRLNLDISSFTNRINDMSDSLASNASIRKILTSNTTPDNFQTQLSKYLIINDIYNSIPFNPALYKSRLYLRNYFDDNKQPISFLNIGEANFASWYKKVNQLNGKVYWTNSYDYKVRKDTWEKVISCVRELKDFNQVNRILAYLCIDIKERYIYNILQETEKTIDGNIYLIGADSKIISCSEVNDIGKNINSIIGLYHVDYDKNNNLKVVLNRKESLVISRKLPEANWNIVAVVSTQNFVDKTKVIFISLLQISVLASLLSLILAAFLSGNITGRIKKLIEFIHKVDVEKNVVPLDPVYTDEISELINAFNNKVYENHILVNEVYKKDLERKNAELKLLQAQINPHFLYNALDTANWMALKYDARDIMKFLKLLSNFYRLSLSMGNSIVNIDNEIKHVRSYVDIQKIKYNDEFEAVYEISPEILNFSIPKLILQPIVENAIIHGIQELDDSKGLIELIGTKEDSIIKITIKDNGIGISKEKLEELIIKIQKESGSSGSYGLRNVNQRIKYYFGEQYGMNIFSEYGKGTVVEVIFPAVIENDKNQ